MCVDAAAWACLAARLDRPQQHYAAVWAHPSASPSTTKISVGFTSCFCRGQRNARSITRDAAKCLAPRRQCLHESAAGASLAAAAAELNAANTYGTTSDHRRLLSLSMYSSRSSTEFDSVYSSIMIELSASLWWTPPGRCGCVQFS
eukprot:363073-Chlamydomonas_euryale.AAC.9